jgi:Leishmanolysin
MIVDGVCFIFFEKCKEKYILLSSYIISLFIFSSFSLDNVNYSTAFPSTYTQTFGYKQGCAFAKDSTCITGGNGLGVPPHYLTATAQRTTCRVDGLGYGWTTVTSWGSSLLSQYTYFSDNTLGGPLKEADFCPLILPLSSNANANVFLTCASSTNALSTDKTQGMIYGSSSICLTSSLHDSSTTTSANPVGCYAFTCTSLSTGLLTIALPTSNGIVPPGNMSAVCSGFGGNALTFTGFSGTITCPNVTAICTPASSQLVADIAAMNVSGIRNAQSIPVYVAPWSPSGNSSGLTLSWIGIIWIAAACVIVLVMLSILIAYFVVKATKERRLAALEAATAAASRAAIESARASRRGAAPQDGIALMPVNSTAYPVATYASTPPTAVLGPNSAITRASKGAPIVARRTSQSQV